LGQGGRLDYPVDREVTPSEVLSQAGIDPARPYEVERLALVNQHGWDDEFQEYRIEEINPLAAQEGEQ